MLVPEKTYKNRCNYRASNDPPGIGIRVNVPTPAKIEAKKVHSVIKTLVCFQRDLVCIALEVGPCSLFYSVNFLFPLIWCNIFGKAENCPPALDKKQRSCPWSRMFFLLQNFAREKRTKLHWSSAGASNFTRWIYTWKSSPTPRNAQMKLEAPSPPAQPDFSSPPALGSSRAPQLSGDWFVWLPAVGNEQEIPTAVWTAWP